VYNKKIYERRSPPTKEAAIPHDLLVLHPVPKGQGGSGGGSASGRGSGRWSLAQRVRLKGAACDSDDTMLRGTRPVRRRVRLPSEAAGETHEEC
jgi:hypothetical protein